MITETTIIMIGLITLPIFMGLQRFARSYGFDYDSKEQAIHNAKFAFKFGCVLSLFGFWMLFAAGCTYQDPYTPEKIKVVEQRLQLAKACMEDGGQAFRTGAGNIICLHKIDAK